jgi:hypothetical protein
MECAHELIEFGDDRLDSRCAGTCEGVCAGTHQTAEPCIDSGESYQARVVVGDRVRLSFIFATASESGLESGASVCTPCAVVVAVVAKEGGCLYRIWAQSRQRAGELERPRSRLADSVT